ncbi:MULTISPECIES: phospholipase D-like domain-containing protein [Candidatus Rhabdochlamydia]|uniref:phospholipase D-like domain-containing protein n=1 Tax=Candidatus Rhabdochlamydia TaxID=292833 RepID=UPI001BFBFD15|nr:MULTISPECIES: phospholipase D-like domain-containing protein [Rhabdochlamydia]MCL6755561.1 phospholipase D-like domain-containing protein [Candidatus Rhabdochlamydia oedothoracis]
MKRFKSFFILRNLSGFIFFRVSLSLLIGSLSLFFIWLVFTATTTTFPSIENPLIFYSNQTRDDIKAVFYRSIKEAKSHVYLSIYGLTDVSIIHILKQKGLHTPVEVYYDSSASPKLNKKLKSCSSFPVKTKGLMHRKILILDKELVFLGSANFTPSSLLYHSNLVIGLYHPPLASFLQNPASSYYSFEINQQQAEAFLLPTAGKEALAHILQLINQAKKTIDIASFTLTHPLICDALISAKNRNVDLNIVLDGYSAKGASKKALDQLKAQGLAICASQGAHLLHHKLCVIDREILITGSANWTKAAFSKNADLLLVLYLKDPKLKKFLKKLCKMIKVESKLIEN